MSFGFSVGDFLTILDLTRKLYKAFKDAPGEFVAISRDLQSFYIVVADLEEQAGDRNSHLNRYATARKPELIAIRDNLVATMKELGDLHERYKRMGRVSWSRFSFGQENLALIRSKLVIQISAVNTFIGSLNTATLGRMEPMLERIFALLTERVRENSVMAQTVLSANMEDGPDGDSWAMVELDLTTQGIPPEYIQENQEHIREILGSVVELNHLDGIDSGMIDPDDSVSQIGLLRIGGTEMQGSGQSQSGKATSSKKKFHISTLRFSRLMESKPRIAPYNEWIQSLSPEQKATRIKLMNHGFDIQEMDLQNRPRDKLGLLKSRIKSDSLPGNAIYWAATSSEQSALKLLLERGYDPYSLKWGVAAPVLAAEAGNWDAVTILLESRASEKIPYCARRLIHVAAKANRVDMIALLLGRGIDVDDTSTNSQASPLHTAAEHGSFEAAELLLKRGANLNRRTPQGLLPLSIVIKGVEQERSVDLFRLLLENGANARDAYCKKPSSNSRAAADSDELFCQDWPLLNRLVLGNENWDENWNRSSLIRPDESPATKALTAKRAVMANLLLEAGANANFKPQGATSPLFIAIQHSNESIVQILLEKGANFNDRDHHDYTPLHRAVQGSNGSIVQILLDHGANINEKYRDGGTPLFKAINNSNASIVQILLDHGANINEKGYNGDTPLHCAGYIGNINIIQSLLDKGADPEAKNHVGYTPLSHYITHNKRPFLWTPSSRRQHEGSSLPS